MALLTMVLVSLGFFGISVGLGGLLLLLIFLMGEWLLLLLLFAATSNLTFFSGVWLMLLLLWTLLLLQLLRMLLLWLVFFFTPPPISILDIVPPIVLSFTFSKLLLALPPSPCGRSDPVPVVLRAMVCFFRSDAAEDPSADRPSGEELEVGGRRRPMLLLPLLIIVSGLWFNLG